MRPDGCRAAGITLPSPGTPSRALLTPPWDLTAAWAQAWPLLSLLPIRTQHLPPRPGPQPCQHRCQGLPAQGRAACSSCPDCTRSNPAVPVPLDGSPALARATASLRFCVLYKLESALRHLLQISNNVTSLFVLQISIHV